MSLPNNYKGNVITMSQETLARDRKIATFTPAQYQLQERGEKLITINGVKHYSAFFWPDVPECRAMLEACIAVKQRHEKEDEMLLTSQMEMSNKIARGEIG